LGAHAKNSHHVRVGANLLHDLHFLNQVVFLPLSSVLLDSFDSNKDGAFVSTDIVHLSLPNLPEVALAQHRL